MSERDFAVLIVVVIFGTLLPLGTAALREQRLPGFARAVGIIGALGLVLALIEPTYLLGRAIAALAVLVLCVGMAVAVNRANR